MKRTSWKPSSKPPVCKAPRCDGEQFFIGGESIGVCHSHYLKIPQETRSACVNTAAGTPERTKAHEALMEFFVTKRVACKHLIFFKDSCEFCGRK
jgi:hypothetical protein